MLADWTELPNGATLVYPVGVSRVYGGAILEGEGVTPDIEVALDPAQLLEGTDSQLQAALDHLRGEDLD